MVNRIYLYVILHAHIYTYSPSFIHFNCCFTVIDVLHDQLTSSNGIMQEEDHPHHLKSVQALHSTTNKPMSLLQEARYYLLHEERFMRFGRVAQMFSLSTISRATDERLSYTRRQEIQYHYNIAKEGEITKAVEQAIHNEHYNKKNHLKHVHTTTRDVEDQEAFEGHTFLPSSITGSARHQSQLFNDALFTAAKDGEPSMMLTMSANPEWPEIAEQLFEGQTAADRTDITCQVFKGKLHALLQDLRSGVAFGGKKTAYILHVIEFQWRKLYSH